MNQFCEKVDDSTNVPKAISVQDFWSFLKRKVYAKSWITKNIENERVT